MLGTIRADDRDGDAHDSPQTDDPKRKLNPRVSVDRTCCPRGRHQLLDLFPGCPVSLAQVQSPFITQQDGDPDKHEE
jgi:hypothetical protein